jgi:hypothetical protein
MKRVIASVLFALFFTLIPPAILRLDTETGFVGWCKNVVTYFMVPGTLVGLVLSGFKVDDVNMTFADIANFVFYFLIAYSCLLGWSRYKQSPHA